VVERSPEKAGVGGSTPSLATIALDLLVVNGKFNSRDDLDYHDGVEYPRLVRTAAGPDLLKEIASPRTAQH
jgi:hypothetical protein